MKNKGLIIGAVVVAAIFGLIYFRGKTAASTNFAIGDTIYKNSAPNDLCTIIGITPVGDVMYYNIRHNTGAWTESITFAQAANWTKLK